MHSLWILFVLLYALLKGSRDGMKKAALQKSGADEILFFYTLVGLILILPFSGSAFSLAPIYIFYAFIKAAVVGLGWIFAYAALRRISVSLYGIMDLSRILFSTALGVWLLGERFTLPRAAGLSLVLTGLVLVNLRKTDRTGTLTAKALCFTLLNCLLTAVSETMDKVLMQHMESAQLQFWFMLFMVLIYGAVLLFRRERISVKTLKTNYWIGLMSLSLVIGDRLLFEANANPASELTLMTVIKQSAVVVTVLTGYFAFGEKQLAYKLFCTAVTLGGIFIAVLL
ncbi:MAG: hypothetical protein E7390_00515 [Ruminococcaceae bacterium]|nr:hypothetical protein [Oscillospiraceae bacterium]